jgi:hypothetical protein
MNITRHRFCRMDVARHVGFCRMDGARHVGFCTMNIARHVILSGKVKETGGGGGAGGEIFKIENRSTYILTESCQRGRAQPDGHRAQLSAER